MEFRIKKLEMLAVAIVALGLLAAYAFMGLDPIVAIVIGALLLIVIIAIALVPEKAVIGRPAVDDERLKMADVYAANYSWRITFLFVCLLGAASYTHWLDIRAGDFAVLVIFCMALTRLGYRAYFNSRGDVA